MYLSNNLTNRISDKFLNNGVKLFFRSMGKEATVIRGIFAQDIYFDEVQSMEARNIPIALECAHSFAEKAHYRFTGTPSSTKNYFTHLFNTTNQNEWIIKCKGCNQYNDPLGIQHIDLKKTIYFAKIAEKCLILKMDNGLLKIRLQRSMVSAFLV